MAEAATGHIVALGGGGFSMKGGYTALEAGLTDSFGGLEPLTDGLGFLAGSACPHLDGEPERRGRYRELIRGGFPAGYAADDDAALHFTGTALTEVVSDRPEAMAYRVERDGEEIVETRLPTRLLTDKERGRET